MTWQKPRSRPKTWSKEQWGQIPEEFTVRLIKVKEYTPGFRSNDIIIVTTLMDTNTYKSERIEELYMKRWAIEVFFRDAKTSLGMDILKSKTPTLIVKEILIFVIAYNLIRSMVAKAAKEKKVSIYKVSFKGALQQLVLWWDSLASATYENRAKIMTLSLQEND